MITLPHDSASVHEKFNSTAVETPESEGTLDSMAAIVMDERAQLKAVEERLVSKFGDRVPKAVIQRQVQNGMQSFADARIRTYIPVLLLKQVTEALRQAD